MIVSALIALQTAVAPTLQPIETRAYIVSTADGIVTYTAGAVQTSNDGHRGAMFASIGRAPADGPGGEPQFFRMRGWADFDCGTDSVRTTNVQMFDVHGKALTEPTGSNGFTSTAGSDPLQKIEALVCDGSRAGLPSVSSEEDLVETYTSMVLANWRQREGQ